MKGRNVLKLNSEMMNRAIEYWLRWSFLKDDKMYVYKVTQTHRINGAFTIVLYGSEDTKNDEEI
ncbi:MAG TPA: hypothetical protein VIH27_03295 [Nitrososphaerales archaeon]